MTTRIGRFEIVSQLAQSAFSTVYKALDTENQQTVALKVVALDKVKDREALLKRVFDEAEQAKPLSSHNIATLFGVGDEGDQLLAASEYVQGNSVATTLARKDGFSIWDLQDIARQVCQALDHARGHNVNHYSLEPAKVMVQWDGLVKVLGFGMSGMNASASTSSDMYDSLHYAAPEALRGEACDHRSSLFSLGAVLYEMATEQKAFPGETADQVRTAILEGTPPLPVRLKANMNPGLSQLIMKALSKVPEERYQSGQELVKDMEACKSGATTLPGAGATTAKPQTVAASAGVGAAGAVKTPVAAAPASVAAPPKIKASATAVEPPVKPAFKVDPMMADDEGTPAAAARRSFSEMNELPPLKEIYVAPPPPPAQPETTEPIPQVTPRKPAPEKAAVQVREAAQKAVTEIRKTPPKLFLFAIAGAVLLIVLIIVGMTISNYMQDRDSGGPSSVATSQPQPVPANPSPSVPQAAPAQPPAAQPESQVSQPEAAATPAPEPPARSGRGRKNKARPVVAAAPAKLTVSSNPAGAQITFDGNALCTAPCTLTGIAAGQHVVVAAKSGYSSESRSVLLSAGANSTIAIDLGQLGAKLSVSSTPAGAVILIDGKDTGKLTPSVFTLNQAGAHTVAVRRIGYLEETSSVNTEAGQSASMNVVLKQLGSTDEIRAAGGKFKKVFGGGGDTSSMGIVSIKTQPKGAQIMLNNRVLDKTAPFDFYLNPGTYMVDITLSGYKPVHRVINVEQRDKVAIELALTPE